MTIKINGDNSVANPGFTGADTDTGLQVGTDELKLVTGGTARATVDSSGNVAIGTTSPTARLDVRRGDTDGLIAELHQSTGYGIDIGSSESVAYISSGYTQSLAFKTDPGSGQTERARIDSSGRLLLGTTTTASVSADDLIVSTSGDTGITIRSGTSNSGNLFFSDGTSGNAEFRGYVQYLHASNALLFGANASEAMRIDSSGRLLVGTTSTSANARVVIAGRQDANDTGTLMIESTDASPADGNTLAAVRFSASAPSGSNSAAEISVARDGGTWTNNSSMPGMLKFNTTANGASTPTERMRITSAGVVNSNNWSLNGQGTTTASSCYLGTFAPGSSAMAFATNGSERARIDSSGNLLYGKTTAAVGTAGFSMSADGRLYSSIPNNNTYHVYDTTNSAFTFYVHYNGGIYNVQSNNVNLSDERVKKNIESLDSTWECLKHWELKKFHYTQDADTDDKKYGVIAQQVAPHCPEIIADWVSQPAKDAILDEDGNVVTPATEEVVRMGVKESQMMWMAIKALQEAQDRIETLEAKVAALEAG